MPTAKTCIISSCFVIIAAQKTAEEVTDVQQTLRTAVKTEKTLRVAEVEAADHGNLPHQLHHLKRVRSKAEECAIEDLNMMTTEEYRHVRVTETVEELRSAVDVLVSSQNVSFCVSFKFMSPTVTTFLRLSHLNSHGQ